MSLSGSVLMIRADVRPDMRQIFEAFDYKPVSSSSSLTWEAALAEMRYPRPDKPREVVHKAVCHLSGWTVILDPELLMVTEEKACSGLSARYGAPVFGMICQGTSGTYLFSRYDGDERRTYWTCDGEVQEDHGSPIPEERGIDLSRLFEDDVLLIMERVGVSYRALESVSAFDVWELDESHLSPPGVAAAPPPPPRPWWKVW